MTFRDLIPTLYVPVLLGDTAEHRRIARRLFWSYGLPSHLFGERFSLVCRLTPWLICHPLPPHCTSPIFLMALTDFAREIELMDRQALLVVNETIHPLIQSTKDMLDTHYLICSEREMYEYFTPPYPTKEDLRHD